MEFVISRGALVWVSFSRAVAATRASMRSILVRSERDLMTSSLTLSGVSHSSRRVGATGGDAETSTGDDAEASTGDGAEASTGDGAEASAGDDAEASTGGTCIGSMTSLIGFTPKTPGTSTKDFEVHSLRAETGRYPPSKGHRGSVPQTVVHVSPGFCGCKLMCDAALPCLLGEPTLHVSLLDGPSSRRRASCGVMLVRSISKVQLS
jgi:hypothetical protein